MIGVVYDHGICPGRLKLGLGQPLQAMSVNIGTGASWHVQTADAVCILSRLCGQTASIGNAFWSMRHLQAGRVQQVAQVLNGLMGGLTCRVEWIGRTEHAALTPLASCTGGSWF